MTLLSQSTRFHGTALMVVSGMLMLGALGTLKSEVQDPVFFNYKPLPGWPAASWDVGNDQFRASFRQESDGTFHWVNLADSSGKSLFEAQTVNPSSPINLRIDNTFFDARTPLKLVSQRGYEARNGGRAWVIVFHDLADQYEIELHLRIHPGHPVLRQMVKVQNLRGTRIYLRSDNILPYSVELEETDYKVFRVNQWSTLNAGRNFETVSTTLSQRLQKVTMITGAGGAQCAWLAVLKKDNVGMLAGWEFDGRADVTVERKDASLDLSVNLSGLMHPVEPQEWYEAPAAFAGVFTGDWDEAGYRTQRYAEAALAPIVADEKFPYIAWDSWGYGEDIDEVKMRREADLAAARGVELFVLDLGWAKQMGDWEADPKKFPSGMRAFSDYVHRKGMKFGLHFVISEAMAGSQVLKDHPDWACSTNYNYHGAVSLALGHQPVQDWVIAQGVRLIQDYNVDWILQDGQTMVKQCTNKNLSYDYRDWNFAGDYGLNRILKEIQAQAPNALWENCANGGNMMTFRMVRNYVTSITNDASGSLGARQGLYGASFPFSPRYTDRYMGIGPINSYNTRSFMFGGPWILMNKLIDLTAQDLDFLQSEIETYKVMRQSIRDGKVSHLTLRPANGRTDAIESYNPVLDEAIVVVVRDDAALNRYTLRFRDLVPTQTYKVSFETDTRILTMTGAQLMLTGVNVNLPDSESGEIVYARPLVQ